MNILTFKQTPLEQAAPLERLKLVIPSSMTAGTQLSSLSWQHTRHSSVPVHKQLVRSRTVQSGVQTIWSVESLRTHRPLQVGERLRGGGVEGWKGGGVEGWNGGMVEGWKGGIVEGRNGGGAQGWNGGRVE